MKFMNNSATAITCAILVAIIFLLLPTSGTESKEGDTKADESKSAQSFTSNNDGNAYREFIAHHAAKGRELTAYDCFYFDVRGRCLVEGLMVLPSYNITDYHQTESVDLSGDSKIERGFCNFRAIPPFDKYSILSFTNDMIGKPDEELIAPCKKNQLGFHFEGYGCTSSWEYFLPSYRQEKSNRFLCRNVLIDSAFFATEKDEFHQFILIKLHNINGVLFGTWYRMGNSILGPGMVNYLTKYEGRIMGYVIAFPYASPSLNRLRENTYKPLVPISRSDGDIAFPEDGPNANWAWQYLQEDAFQTAIRKEPVSIDAHEVDDGCMPYSKWQIEKKKPQPFGG